MKNYSQLQDFASKGKALHYQASKHIEYFLHSNGITRFDSKFSAPEWSSVFEWDDFDITGKILKQETDTPEWYFNFTLNGLNYCNKTLSELKKQLYECQAPNQGKYCLNYFVKEIIKSPKIKKIEVRDVMGFTEDGWQLPNDYFFDMKGHRRGARDHFLKTATYDGDLTKIPELYRDLYNETTMKHKDLVYAYGEVAPFLYALRQKTGLMPILSLNGSGDTGKTWAAKVQTIKKWSTYDTVLGPTSVSTGPRMDGVFTSGTLPILIDDAENLPETAAGIIKTYTTTEDRARKLTADQEIGMNAVYCTPLILTHNVDPPMYQDIALRLRAIIIDIKKSKGTKEWLVKYNAIPDHAVGKYIIEKTRTLTFEKLYEWYETIDLSQSYYDEDLQKFEGDARGNTILRSFALGQHLAKFLYDIDLDVSELPDYIVSTRVNGSQELYDLVQNMIDISDTWDWDPVESKNFKYHNWVKSPVEMGEYKSTPGYFISAQNKRDLMKFIGDKLSMTKFVQHLEVKWPEVHYGCHKGQTGKTIFIPNKYLTQPVFEDPVKSLSDEEIAIEFEHYREYDREKRATLKDHIKL